MPLLHDLKILDSIAVYTFILLLELKLSESATGISIGRLPPTVSPRLGVGGQAVYSERLPDKTAITKGR